MKLFCKTIFSTTASLVLICGLAVLTPSTLVAETLKMIKDKGQISVGTEAHYPPMEFLQDGKIVGYGKDILDLVIADLGVELNQLELPWQGILPGILAKKFDMVATSVAITPERAEKYAFTRPVATFQTMIIKRQGASGLSKLWDANGKSIGVELGSVGAQQVEDMNQQLKQLGGSGFSDIRAFTSTDDMRLALARLIWQQYRPLPLA